jgi:hypothetical protein
MKIEKGIPLPNTRAHQRWPFREMEVGDSFSVPLGDNRRVRNAACAFERANPGVKFTVRKLDGEHRVWRIS